MAMDFALLLVVLVFVTGIISLIDKLVWSKRRQENEEESWWLDTAKSFFPVLLIVLLLRSFLVEPFRIPSGSMMPTLLVGDFILVNKFSYGLRLPVLGSKIVSLGEPQRGDVVVFKYPENPRIDFIKRVIGLPGDNIRYVNKVLYVNDQRVDQEILGTYPGAGKSAQMLGATRLHEDLLGIQHDILVVPGFNQAPEGEFKVPQGNYFVMGDNRDNSRDSRFWGFVPEQNLVGKAFFIWLSWDWNQGIFSGFQASRIGNSIH